MCVAPKPRAASSFRSSTSTAMIVVAPTTLRPGDGRVADPTAADHRDRVTAAHAPGVHGRAEPGHHPAAEQAHGRGVCVAVDLGALPRRDERLLDERPDAERRGELGAVGERHPLGRVVGGEAVPGLALEAGAALAAHRAPVEDDEVARRDVGDPRADRLDGAGRLVAEEEREVVVDAALAVVQVGVADAARLDADDRLAGTGVGHHDVDELDVGPLGAGDDSLDGLRHGSSSVGGLGSASHAPSSGPR